MHWKIETYNMGIQVEFNPDLALRHISEYDAGRRKEAECIPASLQKGNTYSFLKQGQRNYWFEGEIPLLQTKGNGDLSLPLASIQITEATHIMKENVLWTQGIYLVKEVFEDATVHFNGFAKIDPQEAINK